MCDPCVVVLTMFVSALISSSNFARAQSTAKRKASAAEAFVYDVTMLTTVRIPEGRDIEQLRVWHALPTKKPWSSDVSELAWRPRTGERQFNAAEESHHVFFQRATSKLRAGQRCDFQTKFKVFSQSRDFDPRTSKTRWSHISSFDAMPSGNPQIRRLADSLRRERTPAEAIVGICEMIRRDLKYDASVNYPTSDVDSILKFGRGHCGHKFRIFRTVCEELGIPVRRAVGMSLRSPDGGACRLYSIRADYCNIHTWAEVFLEKDGWVEVEPNGGSNAFRIPASYVQNNKWFQNYSVWFRENGQEHHHEWARRSGANHSDFQLSNVISFTKRRASPR